MKVNSTTIVMAVTIAVTLQGCCWLGSCPCSNNCNKKATDKCCSEQRAIGVKANVGPMGASAGVGTNGAHLNATTGK